MRSLLCLAALAALVCAVAAGPAKYAPGCYGSDTHPKYDIVGSSFVDYVAKDFVDMAYVQARKRGAKMAAKLVPWYCIHTGHKPVRACYNSIIPGTAGAPQIGGQYGFTFAVYFRCWGKVVTRHCAARLNTLRDNRPDSPDFWWKPRVACH